MKRVPLPGSIGRHLFTDQEHAQDIVLGTAATIVAVCFVAAVVAMIAMR